MSKAERPVYGRMFQTPFSDQIRNEAHIDTIAVGAISEADHANSIVAAGRADLCAIARPHLADPAWTLHEAAKIGVTDVAWPKQYHSAARRNTRPISRAPPRAGGGDVTASPSRSTAAMRWSQAPGAASARRRARLSPAPARASALRVAARAPLEDSRARLPAGVGAVVDGFVRRD